MHLDGATNLAVGQFYDPVLLALKEVGYYMNRTKPYIDPFAGLEVASYASIALSFAGNEALTTSAGAFDDGKAGRLFEKDEIVGGKLPSFSGTLPMLHILVGGLSNPEEQDTRSLKVCFG